MPRSTDQALAELASTQFGLLTRSQALDVGLTEDAMGHRIRTGRWDHLHPQVYRIAGTPASPEQRLLAACLLGGDGTVVARRAAAWLWQLPGGLSAPVHVVSPRGQRVRRRGIDAHESERIDTGDRTTRHGIPVTTICRTIIDCCGVLPMERAGPMLDDARRRGLLTLGAFARRVDELAAPGRNGIALARRLATDRGTPPASVFESRLARLLVDAGLPTPAVNFRVRLGGETFELDFAYPERRLAIEADSEAFHLDLRAFHQDRRKQNALVLAGWTVLRFTWADLSQRASLVVRQVSEALGRP